MFRLAVAGLVSLAPLVGAAGGAASLTDPTAPAPPANTIAAATALPGPGPLPARVPLALLKAHQGAATLDDAIDQCVTQSMTEVGTPGASVAVAMDGALILERGYGIFLADLDEDGELDSDFEFIERGAPERAGWLRNRSVVGVRRTTPRHAGGALTP
jgi:hypothetical protein